MLEKEKLTRLFKSELSHTEVCLSASTWVVATVMVGRLMKGVRGIRLFSDDREDVSGL